MRYTSEITINRPVDVVTRLFDDPKNLYAWMDGLQSFELLSGEQGQPGAKAKLVYQMGKRRIEMIETITERNLPDIFAGTYDADGVHNIVVNKFIALPDGNTRYITENEFQFKGFMRIIAFLMPGAFKKQSYKYLEQFKAFVENHKEA